MGKTGFFTELKLYKESPEYERTLPTGKKSTVKRSTHCTWCGKKIGKGGIKYMDEYYHGKCFEEMRGTDKDDE